MPPPSYQLLSQDLYFIYFLPLLFCSSGISNKFREKKKKKIQSLPPFEASSPIHELTNFYTAWCERLNKYPLKNFLVMFLCFPLGDSLLPGCRAASRKSCFCSQKKQEGTKSTFNTSYLKMKHVWFNQVTYITASTDWHFVLLSFLREN